MSALGTGAMCCMHCGRPMLTSVMVGGMLYHEECTRGPGWQREYFQAPVTVSMPLTDERIRQIVRDELVRAGLLSGGAVAA